MKIRNNFTTLAEAYDKYRRDYPEKVYELIYDFCSDKESKVLDLGCGTGIVTFHLSKYYKHVTGADKDEKMIELAQSHKFPATDFIAAPAEKIPLPNEFIDLVTVASAYHWFDYEKATAEIYRILKPGGKLCVFWKSGKDGGKYYLPKFAFDNILKFISEIPKSNRGILSEEIFYKSGFKDFDDEELEFSDSYTKEEILGYIKSHTTYNLLDDAQKVEYMKLNEIDVEKNMSEGRFVFKSLATVYFVKKV